MCASFRCRSPRAFLAQFPDGAVWDEILNAPTLLSRIQVLTDADVLPSWDVGTLVHAV